MNTNQQQAAAHATKIEWDTYEAFDYAFSLLTECNMHTEAAALKAAYEKMMEDADFSNDERPDYNND